MRTEKSQRLFEKSQQAFANGQYQQMVDFLNDAAELGHDGAQDSLAYCYEKGFALSKNLELAKHWYETAIAADNPQAMYRLAELKYKLNSGEADLICNLLNHAVALDYPLAKRVAAFILLHTKEKKQSAESHLISCSKNGDVVSQFNLVYLLILQDRKDEAKRLLGNLRQTNYPLSHLLFDQNFSDDSHIDMNTAHVSAANLDKADILSFQQPEWKQLNNNPDISLAQAILSLPECAYLINSARPHMQQATVITPDATDDATISKGMTSKVRTGASCFIRFSASDFITHYIHLKISSAVQCEAKKAEPISVLNYGIGNYYRPHFDYFDPDLAVTERLLQNGGQRISTSIAYLQPASSGGGTRFPEISLSVEPEIGDILHFKNCTEQGAVDPLSLHEGLPVAGGEKWIATIWHRQSETNYINS